MYMGNARRHWKETTMVVETTNVKANTRGSSPSLRLIERFRRTGKDSYACHEGNYGLEQILRTSRLYDR